MRAPSAGRLFWTHLLLICGLCLFAGSAGAQQPSQAQANAIKQSCRSDYQSYCASVPTGGSASLQCLQQHVSELSSPCQSAVNAVSGGGGASRPPAAAAQSAPPPAAAVPPMSPRQEMAMLRGACGGDYRAYCRGVPLGGGNAMACLAQNQARLSRPCKTALAEARAAR